ncbi:hypothetical protein FF100_01350 [Methylobacterium terricola]|uniref:PAS fold-3 domain-containing protein n=1 Tax=Methylobacterium terricola TaxID=2583531 RepID=A0A5C4LNW6_9HYPH|nr:PAS domain-containing protein [Methylobacterium terricola]TNC15940.1 hypothetical protein FF100_01350 [Methylobacterium terricola]
MRGTDGGPAELPPDGLAVACAAPDAVATWQWDIGRNVLCGDARMAALYEVEPADLRSGAPVPLLLARIHPEDRGAVIARIRRAADQAGSYVVPYRLLSRQGAVRWVLSCGRCAHDDAGRPTEGRGVIIDLTDGQSPRRVRTRIQAEVPLADHPLERAAELGLALRGAVDACHDPFLRRLADMLLLEIGRRLAAGQAPAAWTNFTAAPSNGSVRRRKASPNGRRR